MSVQPGPTFKRYAANGLAPTFAIPFLLLDAADLQITLNGVLVTAGFTLAGIGSPTSSCTFTVNPTGDLLFQQVMVFQRLADYQINGDFLAQTVNRDYDRLWLAIKQVNRDSGRALTVSLLEPEGIPPLPSKAQRALKVLAFDALGQPITSSLTLEQLEQQPNLAADAVIQAQEAADAAGGSASQAQAAAGLASDSAVSAAGSATAAAASAASVTGAAVFLHAVEWWGGNRAAIPAGYVPADGQLLNRALYPDAWASIAAGNMPMVADAVWLSTPSEKGKYTTGNGTTTFRVPDYNGKSAGAYGAPFLRGDGGLSAAVSGVIRQDQFQGHAHDTKSVIGAYTSTVSTGDGLASATNAITNRPDPVYKWIAGAITDGTNGVPRVGTETRPIDVCGCFIIKLFGAVTNQGAADAAQLATELATVVSRVSVLESKTGNLEFGFASGPQTFAAGGSVTVLHGLGSRPAKLSVTLQCAVAELGYAVGESMDFGPAQPIWINPGSYGFSSVSDASSVSVNISASGAAVLVKSTRLWNVVTPANWRLIIKASKS